MAEKQELFPFQTVQEYLDKPFGNDNPAEKKKMEETYQKIRKRIRVVAHTTIGDEWLMHIEVPSESNNRQKYDVVLLFFTDDEKLKKSRSLNQYYIKLFSNSPAFIYQYAALYKDAGFMIDFLLDKMDPEWSNVLPKNPKPLFYDKSIYCACRFLMDHVFASLHKTGIRLTHRKDKTRFFRDIKSFSDVKFTTEMNQLDKRLEKEIKNKKQQNKDKKREERERNKKRRSSTNVKEPTKSTINKESTIKSAIRVGKKIRSNKKRGARTTSKK